MSGALFGGAAQNFLSRLVSEHFPIILVGGALMIEGALPFRFKNMWLKAQSFKNLISN